MESKYDNNENMISTLTNFDNNIRTNSWDNIVEQYYLKRDEMKTLFKYGCVRECNKQCGNKRKSETYRKIILFDRYQSTV
jgi:hypothetical protein